MATALYFILGLAGLLGGAHLLVQSSSKLAFRFGIPAIIVGVTIVAFATSAPEVAVSLNAVISGEAGIAIGNVLGSNITNILLILGISALISPIMINRRIIRIDVPIMIGASIAVYLLALDGQLQLLDGLILLVAFAGFIGFQVWEFRRRSRGSEQNGAAAESQDKVSPGVQSLLLLAGLALLVLGSHWLVESAIVFAQMWGLSELVIGLTIIAVGTSLPEVATSVIAAWQDEADLSIGNILGSNVFNLLLVLGICAVFSGDGLQVSEAALALDFPFMIAVSIACLPIFFIGRISRWEGSVFLGYYAAYLLYLFLDTTQHQFLPLFNDIVVLFVVPITLLTIVMIVYRSWRQKEGITQNKS